MKQLKAILKNPPAGWKAGITRDGTLILKKPRYELFIAIINSKMMLTLFQDELPGMYHELYPKQWNGSELSPYFDSDEQFADTVASMERELSYMLRGLEA